jgi:hypothetical protein
MRAHRAWSTSYLVSGFVISMAIAASVGEGRAQVDPNLQSRINVFSPPITTIEIAPQAAPSDIKGLATTGATKCPPDPARPGKQSIKELTRSIQQLRGMGEAAAGRIAKNCGNLKALSAEEMEICKAAAIQPIDFSCRTQPTTLKFSLISNPTYETNVLKSNQNIHPDTSLGLTGSGLFTTHGFRDYDIIAFNAQSASARYTNFPSRSLDAFTVQGLYQFFLDAQNANGKPIDPSKDNLNMISYDVLVIGFVNQTSFVPTYRAETADLFTPQATLARQNIGLLGSSDPGCRPWAKPDPSKPLQPGYCYFANISVTAGQTFSDVPTLQNTNVALSGTVSKRFDQTDWVLSVAGTATAKSFENVPGGRQDLQLQLGPQASYSPSKCVSFSLSVTYYRNYSTLATAAWNGFIVQPQLTVNFGVEPAPDQAHYCG